MRIFAALALLAVVHHPVSTAPGAQAAFDRGLLDYYAYNPEAAEHEFYTAADLDPKMAMAYWGIALSNAPNLNVPPNDQRDKLARFAIGKAKALEATATAEDQAFINAAAARFADTTKAQLPDLLVGYRDALQKIAQANPDDPDAAALYAEAALYVFASSDKTGTSEMSPDERARYRRDGAALLPYYQAELARFPMHIGLEHFFIHAAQYAGQSALAVDAARHLASFTFPPEDSHLTHMPGHTFFDVGMYDEGLDVARRSVAMDYADFACCHPGFMSAPRYYHGHNVVFLLYALTETGHTAEAVKVAQRENNPNWLAKAMVADGRWKEIIAEDTDDSTDPIVQFARGLAYVRLGDAKNADGSLAKLPEAPTGSVAHIANLTALRETLAGEIAEMKGDHVKALQLLTDASVQAAQAWTLVRPENPDMYYFSPHMALANLAIALGKTDIALAALQAELVSTPKSNAAIADLKKIGSN